MTTGKPSRRETQAERDERTVAEAGFHWEQFGYGVSPRQGSVAGISTVQLMAVCDAAARALNRISKRRVAGKGRR